MTDRWMKCFLVAQLMAAYSCAMASPRVVDDSNMILKTEPAAGKKARMAWWKEARFGMFVHWGLYSTAEGEWDGKVYGGGAEWIQKRANVSADVYQQTLLPQFKPSPDFASQWARLAKQAGAKYVVFTSKHHEGFALHDSAQSEYDAESVTGRDLHKEIVTAIRREGLNVGVYHSLWDWHHPDAPAGDGALNVKGLSMEGRELSRYADYLHAQVNELTDGRYGDVDILWLDYSKEQYQGEAWGAKKLVSMLRSNQPDILINNRLWKNEVKDRALYEKYWTGDFSTPEQHIPATGIEGIDWETCDTLNGTWGWSKHATHYKTIDELVHRMVDAVSKGGNYLLNIGPLPDGSIPPQTEKLFGELGGWMQVNGEAIYGTQAGPFARLPWGRATSKKLQDGTHRLYLHVFDWPANGALYVPGLQTLPIRSLLVGGKVTQNLRAQNAAGKITIQGLPENPLHAAATVIALDFNDAPVVSPYRVYASTDGSFMLEPADATIKTGTKFQDHGLMKRSCLKNWKSGGSVAYPLFPEKEITYTVKVASATNKLDAENAFSLSVGDQKVALKLAETGGMKKWMELESDPITIPAGEVFLVLQCDTRSESGDIALSTITLNPIK